MSKNDHGQHHIVPPKHYLYVLAVLLFLTFITVYVTRFDFGAWNAAVAMLVATIKASFVMAIFMHLYYDDKLYPVIIVSSVLFVAILFAFSYLDIVSRVLETSIL